MVTKSERPAAPPERAIALAAVLLAVVALLLAFLQTAKATTVIAQKREDASFRNWVDAAPEIVVARVTGSRRLSDGTRDEKPQYEFTFETIERIKGQSPATFVLNDQMTPGWVKTDDQIRAHAALGAFWLAFSDVDSRNGFQIDGAYLLFRAANGKLADVGGREAEPVKSTGDEWLIAVKHLVADPRARFGREASILELLASSHAIILASTTGCAEYAGGDRRPNKLEIREQFWGFPMSFARFREYDPVGLEAGCELNGLRLVVILEEAQYSGSVFRLRVDGAAQIVDFSGIANGTDDGLIQGAGQPRWSSQLKISGRLKWKLSDLREALRKASIGNAAPSEDK